MHSLNATSAQAAINKTRVLLGRACDNYRYSSIDPVLCRLGEDGTPYRGPECFQCKAGSYTPTGFFMGDITHAE